MESAQAAPAQPGLDRTGVADRIIRDLRLQIISGSLPKGSKLPTEQQLARHYNVSGGTVREAVRGLTAVGLAHVRHGSGAYVTADVQSLIAGTLSTVIQLQDVGAADVLSIFGALFEQAAGRASEMGTAQDRADLQRALEDLDSAQTREAAASAVRGFHRTVAKAAHNPLLDTLCGALSDLQTALGAAVTGDTMEGWTSVLSQLRPARGLLVDAIVSGDKAAAIFLARAFQSQAVAELTSLSRTDEARHGDPQLHAIMLSLLNRPPS